MFTLAHTRIVLVLVIIITFLISFIGLNWNDEKEETVRMKTRLEISKSMTESDSNDIELESFHGDGMTIELMSDEEPEGENNIKMKFKEALEGEGKTIILD